jgi:hypothetical protein
MSIPMPESVLNFDASLNKFDGSIRDFQEWLNKIVRNCERWAPWLKPVAKWMADAIDWIEENVKKLLSEIGKFFTRPGHPIALWENGNRWVDEVGKRAGDQVGVISIGFMNADDKWKGDAAESYFKGLPLQSGAAAGVHAACEKMQSSLHDMALAIGAFWLGSLIAIGKIIVELIPEAAATAVPPTAPAGLAAAVASVAAFIALWGSIVVLFYEYVSKLFNQQTELAKQFDNNTAFPGPPTGTWPKSTTEDLSDGTWNDSKGGSGKEDDKSDWQMRY